MRSHLLVAVVFGPYAHGERFPANELRGLYHELWEFELGLGEIKTDMLERLETLRSKGPTAVAQEMWGLLEWAGAPDDMPWTRMNALDALHKVSSPAYTAKLAEARASTNEYLAPYAEQLANGTTDGYHRARCSTRF